MIGGECVSIISNSDDDKDIKREREWAWILLNKNDMQMTSYKLWGKLLFQTSKTKSLHL